MLLFMYYNYSRKIVLLSNDKLNEIKIVEAARFPPRTPINFLTGKRGKENALARGNNYFSRRRQGVGGEEHKKKVQRPPRKKVFVISGTPGKKCMGGVTAHLSN